MKREYKSYHATKADEVKRNWVLIDAKDLILGKLAVRIADTVRGKNKPDFTPSMDTGDFVVVINADQIRVTGGKETKKKYYRHTGYPGGLKVDTYEELKAKGADRLIMAAVKGMLPKNRLGRKLRTKVKIYSGSEHPHIAQKPEVIS